jgi:hypothetical protein
VPPGEVAKSVDILRNSRSIPAIGSPEVDSWDATPVFHYDVSPSDIQ